MPLVRHRAQIDASVDAVWRHLLDKIERPELYVPAVTRSQILARPAEGVVDRLMYLLGDDGEEREVRERITADEATRTAIFLSQGSPIFTGLVTNTILDDGDGVELDITMNWVERPGIAPQDAVDWLAMVRDAVEQTKRQVEGD